MDILPVDEDDAYVSGLYRIIIGWLVLTILIGIVAAFFVL